MSKRKPDWKNRIVEYGEQPANQYLAHELNARRHPGKQREALIGSLNEVGWVAPVIVSARTGKLLDGHARIEETLTKDENAPVPFVKVDVSENEERTILASFDPITGLATYDREALDALLREVSTGEAALQQMLAELAAQNDMIPRDVDLDDFFNEGGESLNNKHVNQLVLTFASEDEVSQIKDALLQHGNTCELALKKILDL